MNWVRQKREELKLSQDELARELQLRGIDIDRSTIGHWETERRKPKVQDEKFRRALAGALKITEEEVLILAGMPISERHTTAGERAAHIVDKMTPDDQERALRILEALRN